MLSSGGTFSLGFILNIFSIIYRGTKMSLLNWSMVLFLVGYLHMQRCGSLLEVCEKLSNQECNGYVMRLLLGEETRHHFNIFMCIPLFCPLMLLFCFLPCFYLIPSNSPYLTSVRKETETTTKTELTPHYWTYSAQIWFWKLKLKEEKNRNMASWFNMVN